MDREQLQAHRETHTKQNSWWMNDAKGIPLCRVCDQCEKAARAQYRPEVLGDEPGYDEVVEEPIEPEE